MIRSFPLPIILLLAACGGAAPKKEPPPAKTEAVVHETDLLRISLTAQAQKRLGIVTTRVGAGEAARMRETSGEIVAPSIAGGVPTGSTSNLAQIGVAQAAADGEVERTQAQAHLARIALDRATRLVQEEAGSARARDEAAAAVATAQAQANVAQAQRRLLGPGVASLGNQARLWVRVPVFGTDVAAILRGASVMVSPLGASNTLRAAQPVQAPPSANAVAGTVDLYYAMDNRDRLYRVGQRVSVRLPLGGAQSGLTVPSSAIVRDIHGGEWVYEQTAPDSYVRQRVEVAASEGGRAIVARGLRSGAAIVTTGAMELFGTEFGVAH
ncbi:MAG TPA: efflux RND transporter periplasmic adaptor subunit [Sphingobium sp.]|uniref:efflux RND transporter periplasmic adaptor subunit n=1 Tax=Sphingobium sp. TaxID=1912891 RepID=UPI002ED43B42